MIKCLEKTVNATLKYLHRYIGVVFLAILVSVPSNAWSTQQGRTVTGKVTTSEDGTTLPGVNVVEKGTTNGTITDVEGNYSLTVADVDAIIIYSSVGFGTQEIAVGSQTVIDVVLEVDIQALDEVVVIGYGTQMKSELTGSVVSIPKVRLETMQFNNFANAIEGSMPGVSVTTAGGGAEGNDVIILIRGRNSITADIEPLIILDGIPYSGSYSSISPEDIQSIEVLKDASASAIYGSRGANGVILITSKKGTEGRMIVQADFRYGLSTVTNLPDVMDGEEFAAAKIQYDPLDGLHLSEQAVLNSDNPKGTNWLELATRTGSKLKAGISLRGGTEKYNYFVSVNHLDVAGVSKNDDFKRESFRLNMETQLKDWLTFGSNTMLNYADRSGEAADFSGAMWMDPLTLPYDENGDLIFRPLPEDIYFLNPLGPTLYQDEDKSYDLFSNNYLVVKFPWIKGLQYKLNSGMEYSASTHSQYMGRNTPEGFNRGGYASVRNGRRTNVVLENILSYQNSFGNHNLGFTGLYSFQETIRHSDGINARDFDLDVLSWWQMSIGSGISPSQTITQTDLLSWMGRFNYNYAKKYYATFTLRRDGYSGFGANTKWGTFPSVALSWNMKNEDFLSNVDFVNQLKLRISYGKNGNQAVEPYTTISRMGDELLFAGEDFNFNYLTDENTTAPGLVPAIIGNQSLGWEETTSMNLGLDFLLAGRLQGNVDVYNANTDRLLLERTISATHGIESIMQNIGKVNNKGVELALTGYLVSGNDFKWNASVVASYIHNEIVELYGGEGGDDIVNKWFIGQPILSNYDYVFDGILQNAADSAAFYQIAHNSGERNGLIPGSAIVKDLDGNDTINDMDRDLIGHTDPNLHLGVSSTLSYKGISLYFLLQGVFGATRPNLGLVNDNWGYRRNTTNREFWTPENHSNTIPANTSLYSTNPWDTGKYQKADFWRLRDVILSYDLPSSLLDRVGIAGLRIFIQGTNLATFTDWYGMDPEFQTDPAADEDYEDQDDFQPLQKEVLFGISLTF
ncbi:SusC/RagA family TonB-linked outer membrane protein [Bacteroidota bacterium]